MYDVATGELLETYPFPTAGFINDLDISRNAVYATDSVNQQLLVVPLGEGGALPAPTAATTMALTGDLSYSAGFNANGIAARGGWLVLVQSNEGLLFKVNPRTGETTEIDTGGYSVVQRRRPRAARQDPVRGAQSEQPRRGPHADAPA